MKPRERVVAIAVTIGFVFALVSGALAQGTDTEPVRLLIIDETHSIQSSLQVAQFARALKETKLFEIDAMTTIPVDVNLSGQAYNLAVIVPEKLNQLWIVTADLPDKLSIPVQIAFQIVQEIASRVYEGDRSLDARAVADVTEDLFPAIYGGFLVKNGWLRLVTIPMDPSANEGES
ncbi:MAG: hypothetical protein U9Q94_02965 [Candidatus Bipolaricaulota bacterium]|nr:hypothetical protein [Candidatus Bipolaricaulota bacterium]